ncbi:hypothetical protein NIES2119_17735 [[Phormidium ambiguum] IAM M-71]|uniref:Uncharacterized protein n=1 Tax=[Phormidium ambiguum] IAM M-71 TaxID=454136 RepID=A0A1U7IGE4_9CYAN|nr:hypothetical protein [Phormidium ambiguum]OKH36162.1 hypothetical protein NIES2119_17735 [Phormidium ambiguum IAM M-71]
MAKIRVGNTVIKSNDEVTNKHSNLFTEYGRKKINEFLLTSSKDFRVIFDMLWDNYQVQPTIFFDSAFRKVLEESQSFKNFILAVYFHRSLSRTQIPFDQFYLPLIKNCYENYQIQRETGARGWIVGAFHYLIATYPKYGNFLSELIHSLDVTENINSDRFIYVDEHVALTYNQDRKNKGLGELLFAARNSEGLWSFNKTDVFVPVKSLRQAKNALANYQGKSRKGELIGNDSIRFCKSLGLEIRENYAYMPNYQESKSYRGKGFK